MQDTRNSQFSFCNDGRGTVCIDTDRVLDCCRDRDCFEDARVYLTSAGEQLLESATNVRTKSAELVWAHVSVHEVPFNQGFYQVTVRYYIKVEMEACVCIGKSQTFYGIAVLEKDVILYGGEGNVVSYSSTPDNDYCNIGSTIRGTNAPKAVVETVEPIVLGTKVKECHCAINPCDCVDIPECVCCCVNGELNMNSNAPRLYISFGIFSVIRIVRPAQLLVQATDYSVPDKECSPATNNDNPCSLFNTIAFPVNQFRGTTTPPIQTQGERGGNCGCKK